MNNLLKLFIIATVFSFYQIDAQYVVKKDTLSGTVLSFALDERVNNALENLKFSLVVVDAVSFKIRSFSMPCSHR